MKKIFINTSFSKNNFPNYSCPICNKGILILDNENFYEKETYESRSLTVSKIATPDTYESKFVSVLNCNKCHEVVSVLGTGRILTFGDNNEYVLVKYYTPLFFDPPLNLFDISNKCPTKIRKLIINAFRFYWSDYSVCLNQIRKSVEAIMDERKIPKTTMSRNRKKKPLPLHRRIEKYKFKNNDIGEKLFALKWLGNEGSHLAESDIEAIKQGFEILEYIVNELYGNKTKHMNKIVKLINKNKGTL